MLNFSAVRIVVCLKIGIQPCPITNFYRIARENEISILPVDPSLEFCNLITAHNKEIAFFFVFKGKL